MAVSPKLYYEFEGFRLDAMDGLLFSGGELVPLQPKTLETLRVLLAHAGRLLSKEELLQLVWPDCAVEENNLAQNISLLRKTLGAHCIETVPRRGYRFVAPVREIEEEPPALVLTEYTATRIVVDETESADESAAVTLPADVDILPEPPAARLLAPVPASLPVVVQTGEEKSSQTHALRPARRPRWLWLAAVGLAVACCALLVYRFWRKPPQAAVWRAATVTKLPNTGNSVRGALSSDGRFMAHVVFRDGQWGIWLRQLAAAREVELAPLQPKRIFHLEFTPDGSHVYFSRSETGKDCNLYQVPVLGGLATPVSEQVGDSFALAPDGQRLALLRETAEECALLVARADGSQATPVLTHSATQPMTQPAWSPDGQRLAFATWEGGPQKEVQLWEVELSSRRARALSPQRWRQVYGLTWLPDGSGLIVQGNGAGGGQLWRVTYPGGAAQRFTHDLFSYHGVSLAADGQTMLSSISQNHHDLWLVEAAAPAQAKKITTGAASYYQPAWTPDGQIVCISNASGHGNVWLLQADGSQPRPLTAHAAADAWPAVAPDGRTVVFSSKPDAPEGSEGREQAVNLWCVGLDGSGLRQLTHLPPGQVASEPRVTPDGQRVIYTVSGAQPTAWQVPLAGGTPVQLSEHFLLSAAPAPDGKHLVGGWRAQADEMLRLAILPYTAGTSLDAPVKLWEPRPISNFHVIWRRDGRALLYDNAANVMQQALDGGPPQPWTAFSDGQLFGFDLTPDGRRLVCARSFWNYAVVLLKPAE